MSDKSSTNFDYSYCAFDEWESVITPPNLTTELQRESSPTADVDKLQELPLPPSSSMGMEQKPEEASTIDQSDESNDVQDLFKQMQISDTSTPKIPAIDLYSCVPKAAFRGNMANMMSQTRKTFEIYQPFLDNLYSNIEQFEYCLSSEMLTELAKFFEEVQKRMETWSDVLQQIATTDTVTIGSAIFTYIGFAPSSNSDSKQQIADLLQDINQIFDPFVRSDLSAAVNQKCQLAKVFQGSAVPFVGRAGMEMDLATALASSSSSQKSQYVFFHNASVPPGPNTNECRELFNRLISEGERCIYVDSSLASVPSIIPDGDRIAKFYITSLARADYVQEAARKMDTCIVRMEGAISSESTNINEISKDEQFELEIPCPKAAKYGGACSNDECRWECDDCGKLIYIRKPGKDATRVEHFYCDCGQVPLTGAKFRCKDADLHGYEEFIEFPSDKLADQLRYYGEKNLLILGETGVGKSTWINAFANFITFSTLDEAIQSEKPLCLIPTSFPLFDEKDLTERTITIGPQDTNESSQTGQSQTKMPKAHVFELKTGRMRMVDTPGMADTAGLQQDKQNFKHTLRYISTLKELNGIAILIDANQSRLTPAFKYCIGQLLTQLHKDAAKNIVFVFTKCGQRRHPIALSSLRTYLEEVKRNTSVEVKTELDQVYRMENDAFKFIHEVNQGVKYTNADYENMEFSWALSKSESNRLLQHILNLKPHKPMDTFSLNQARSYILALALPLAKISQAIQTDITVLTEKRKWLETLDANELDLETAKNAMKITQSYYEIEHIAYPRTVCNSPQHTEIVTDEQGLQKILYKTICHSKCGLKDVPPETSYCNRLKGCSAMRRTDNCHKCGCHYNEHIHIRYFQHLRTKVVDDDQQIARVVDQLDKTHDKKAAVEDMIILLEKRVNDQHAEQAIISKCSAKLSMFLKRHAIMTYNDAIEEYVLMSIDEEKRIAVVSGDNRKVKGLEDCLNAYHEEKRIINAAMNSKEQPENDEFDVRAIYGELINLQINGQNIKQMFDAEFDSQKKIYDFTERSYPRQTGGKASMNNNRSRQSSVQRGYQRQAQNHSNHGQKQNGKSMASSSSCSNTYNPNSSSNATRYGQFSNSTYGNNSGTANRSQQLQEQQRNGNIGDGDTSEQPKSYADATSKSQNPKDKPSSSTSSKKIPWYRRLSGLLLEQ